jgi:hypothetical protein
MTNQTPQPDDAIPSSAYTNTAGEVRAFIRVCLRAYGILVAYWDQQNMPPAHPYRAAAATIASYLRKRYGEDERA